jgi:hypothetical protein
VSDAAGRLRDELLRILTDEGPERTSSPENLRLALHALGYTPEPTAAEVSGALDELLRAGLVQAVWRRGLVRYRVIPLHPETGPPAAPAAAAPTTGGVDREQG